MFFLFYSKSCLDEIRELFCEDIDDKDFADVQNYLERYCKLCEGVLYYVKKDTEYENIVFYAFERIFSMLLIKQEMDVLWDKVQYIVQKVLKQNKNYNKDKEEYYVCHWLIRELGSQVFYEIACSPGIHHRIRLAQYIFNNYLVDDELFEEYLIYREGMEIYDDIEKYQSQNREDDLDKNTDKDENFGVDRAIFCDLHRYKEYDLEEIQNFTHEEKILSIIKEINELYNERELVVIDRIMYSSDPLLIEKKREIKLECIKQYLAKAPKDVNNFYIDSENQDCASKWLQQCREVSTQHKLLLLWVILCSLGFENYSWVNIKNV